MPDAGQLTVKTSVKDNFFLRPPHWAPHADVRGFVSGIPVTVNWSGEYVRFDAKPGDELTITYPLIAFTHRTNGLWNNTNRNLHMTFHWLGNMVTNADPVPPRRPCLSGSHVCYPLLPI